MSKPESSKAHIDDERQAPKPFVIFIAFAVLCLIWGSTWIVIKQGLKDLPPLTSLGVRFALAALVMAIVAPWIHRLEGGNAPPWWLAWSLGVFNFAFPFSLVYWSETVLPSGIVSLLWAVFPLMVAVCGHFIIPSERLNWRATLGLLGGFSGVALLVAVDLNRFGSIAVPMALLLLLSPLSAAIGTSLTKRYGRDVSSALLNRTAMIIGASLVCIAALILERDKPLAWTRSALLSISYLSVFGTVVTFSLYFWIMRYTSARTMSLITYVTPVVALFLGWFIDGEPVSGITLVGAAIIFASVALVMNRPRKRGRTIS